MQFEMNPQLVLEVLGARAHELAEQGDKTLELEIERATWMTIAHIQQEELNTLKGVEEEQE